MVSIRLPFVLSFFSTIFLTNGFPVAGGPGWPQRYATPQQSGTAQQPPEGQQSGEVQEILPPIGQLPISVAEQQPLPEVNQSAIQPQLIGQYPPGPGVQTNIEGPQPPINGVAQQPPIAQQPITELQPIPALIEPIVPQIPVVGEQTNAGVQQPPIPGLAQNVAETIAQHLEGLQAIQAPLEPIVSQIPVVEEQTNVEVQQPPIPQNGAAHQLIITQQPAEELQPIPAPLEPIVPQIPVVGEQTNDGVQHPPISLQPIVPQIPAVGEQTNAGVQQPPIPVIAQNGAAHQLAIAQHPAEGLSPIPAPEEILEVISQQPPVIAEQPNIVAQKPPMPLVVQHEVVHQQPIAQQPPISSSSEELYQLIAQLASPVTKEQDNVEAQKSRISGVVQHEVAHQIPISQQPQMPVAIPLSLEEILKLIAQQPPVIGEQPNPNVGAQKPLIPSVVQHGVTPIPVAELQPISPTREAQQSLQIAQLPPAADEQPEAQQQGMVQPERPLEQQPSSPEAQFPPMVIALEPATLGMQEPQPKEYIAIMQTYKFIFKF